MSTPVSEQLGRIRALIAANLGDTKIVSDLEEHVKFQVRSGVYDGDSNRELLKLYAVAPDMIKIECVTRLLLKCMMEMPAPEFMTALYLLPDRLQGEESMKLLLKLHQWLETCQFKRFWQEVDAWKANPANAAVVNFDEVKEFDDAIRRCQT